MSKSVLARPPDSYRPDRSEVIQERHCQPPIRLAWGVHFDCLVSPRNGARNLTTGVAAFFPDAQIAYQRYAVSVSLTILEGSVRAAVENREYVLENLDNIVIAPGIPHSIRNASAVHNARIHLAWASAHPTPEPLASRYDRKLALGTSNGVPGKEHINRFATAARTSAGPGTSFIDYFNRDLIPGVEMSGGYGLFHAGGRLPAHFHDFDESICIIRGTATCLVEGRRHRMSGEATALQPRGRVHYFVNESDAPMEMIWVYAGPVPERIVVAEECAATLGVAWDA